MGLKNIEYWEKLLEDMPDSYRKWFEEERRYLQEHITKDASVLEVGCGDGRSIKDIVDITTTVTGIDHDEKAVADTKNNFREYPHIRILKANAEKLPFENKEFDFIICMTTFANFANSKQQVLSEMKRVLKDDGHIIISVFSEDAFEERMKLYKKLNAPIKEIKGTTVIFDEELVDNISEQFSKQQLLSIFSEAGLKVEDIRKKGMAYLCKLKK